MKNKYQHNFFCSTVRRGIHLLLLTSSIRVHISNYILWRKWFPLLLLRHSEFEKVELDTTNKIWHSTRKYNAFRGVTEKSTSLKNYLFNNSNTWQGHEKKCNGEWSYGKMMLGGGGKRESPELSKLEKVETLLNQTGIPLGNNSDCVQSIPHTKHVIKYI